MRRTIVIAAMAAILASAGTSLASGAFSHTSVTWPAQCAHMKCVNAHLNTLHERAQIRAAQVNQLTAGFQSIQNKIYCWETWGNTEVAEYNFDGSPAYGRGGGFLDVVHQDNPRNNPVYHLVSDNCQ